MVQASILQDQMVEREKREQLRKLREKEEDLKDLERIRRENAKLELRKLQEDDLIKDRERRMN